MEFKSISFKLNDFEGPLDLLLHLISKNKLNIYDICLVDLVDQYIGFINQSQQENMDVANQPHNFCIISIICNYIFQVSFWKWQQG